MIRFIGRFLVFFIVLTFFAGDVESITNFTFTGTFVCPKRFDYNTVLLEKDQGLNSDDRFNSPINAGHSIGNSSDFKVFGQQSDDGFPLTDDGNFEVALLITHNCNEQLKPYKHYEIFLGSFRIKETHYVKDLGQIDLFNRGAPTKDVIGRLPPRNHPRTKRV